MSYIGCSLWMFFRSSFSSTHDRISGELFHQSKKGEEILLKVKQFMKQHVYPAEKVKAFCKLIYK